MNHTEALGKEPIGPLLWRCSLPAIIGMLVNALYNIVDSIFVGQGVGELALAAVTIAFPLMTILMGMGMFVGLGAASIASLRLGAGDNQGAECILGNALTLLCLIMLPTTGLALLFLEELLQWLGASPEVLPYAIDFTRIILGGSIFMHISFGLNGLIRAQGDAKTALYTMLIAALLNTALNPLFIFVFHWGIAGSAWATVISQFVATVWVLTYFLYGRSTLRLRRACLPLQKKLVLDISRIGMAPFLMQLGSSLVIVIFNFTLLSYGGNLAIAAFGIVNRVLMLLLMPVLGISQGVQPIVGYNYGAQNYSRVLQAIKLAAGSATLVCIVGLAVVLTGHEALVRLFNDNPELIRIGSEGLCIFLAMLPIIGFQIIGANYFQAIGKAGYSIVFNLLRQFILLIPLVYLLPQWLGLNGIWTAGPVADLGSACLTGFFLLKELRRLKNAGNGVTGN